MQREELFSYLDEYLEIARYRDYGPNGLQVEGKREIVRIALGVSVSSALVDAAVAWGADALLVHHGLFWNRDPRVVRGFRRNRLYRILASDLNLGAYHLPLDAHPVVGNNARLADGLALRERRPFGIADGTPIGVAGALEEPLVVESVLERVRRVCGGDPLVFLGGSALVTRIGIVSGGGGGMFEEAASEGLDLFLTGEPEEPSMAMAAEMGVHFVAAGHYRTEMLGIQSLGEHLSHQFDVEVRFFELMNPV